jgi:thiamine-phosphate pyrophosphorylase
LNRLPPLNAIIDAEASARAGLTVVATARACLDGGARFLQLRGKNLSGAELLDAATAIVGLAHEAGAIVIVNDRADIAKLSGADGVHLGQEDLSPAAARAILGAEAIVGWSTHTDDQIAQAGREPISYLAVGPIFGSTTKATGYDAVGLDIVRRAARLGRPVVAIGGITRENAASVLAAGAASVAVIGALVGGADPAARVRELLDALGPQP